MPLLLIALIFLVVAYVITALLVKRPKIKPSSVDDFEFAQVEEGTPEAVCFGDNWSTGQQVIWYGKYRTIKIKAKGGK